MFPAMKTPPENPSPKTSPADRAATPDEILKQLHEGQFPLAFTLAERLVQAQPESPMAHRLLAMGHLALGRPDEALDSLDTCLELHEKNPAELDPEDLANVYATRALVQLQQDDLWDAAEDAQKALELNPNEPDALFVAMVAAADEEQFDVAHKHAVRLVELAPESPDVHAWLARILSAQGHKREAAKAAARSRELGFTTSELEAIEKEGIDPNAPSA